MFLCSCTVFFFCCPMALSWWSKEWARKTSIPSISVCLPCNVDDVECELGTWGLENLTARAKVTWYSVAQKRTCSPVMITSASEREVRAEGKCRLIFCPILTLSLCSFIRPTTKGRKEMVSGLLSAFGFVNLIFVPVF